MNIAIGGKLHYPFLHKSPVESTNSDHSCVQITRNLRREPLVSVIENETTTTKEAPSLSESISRRFILLCHTKSSWQISFAPRLLGKVAVITGGASGIGESTARLFVKHGAKVLVADIQDELGHSLCKELGTHETITYAHCDVASESDVQNMVYLAVSKFGKLDIMFNNAAIPGKLEIRAVDCDIENFKRVFDVNVCGAFMGAKHAARVMIPAKKGCILFTSSLASMICANVPHAYTASKHAIVGLTRNLSVELGQYGIRVNCISPHAVPTPMFKKAMGVTDEKKIDEAICESAVLKEAKLEAKDIAEAALYLASDESKYVSGVNLAVDGGYRLTNPTLVVAFNSMIS